MIKKLLKGCLTIAMISAMALPAMAAEVTVKPVGKVMAEFVQQSVKDSASTMDMASESRLGLLATATEGDWTMKALTQYRAFDATLNDQLYNWISLENSSMKIAIGKQVWGFVYKSGKAWLGNNIDRYYYGLNALTFRENRLVFTLKEVGLAVSYESNVVTNTKTTGGDTNDTGVGVQYSKAFGQIGLTVAYAGLAKKADKKLDPTEVDGANDGYAKSELALSVLYNVNEMMAVEFDYSAVAEQKGGNPSPDPTSTSKMGIGLDYGLGDGSYVSFGYDMANTKTGDVKTDASNLAVGFVKPLAAAKIFAGYRSEASKTDTGNGTTEDGKSRFAVGLRTDF